MATKWTEEQLQAINTRGGNLLVAAAAGSGKTAVLVERIIKIITDKEKPVDIDRLLVVTFTNAAAAEMRERIADAISKELDKNPNSKLLQRQLTLLSRSNITTMHSFCLDVIRNNFHHIDLDPAFRIAADTEAVLMKQDILQELFEDKFEDQKESFINLVEAFGGGRDDRRLQELVYSLYNFSMSGPWPEKWLKDKAEEFNIQEDFDISRSIWGRVLLQGAEVELKGVIGRIKFALEICENTEGLEPYIENLTDDAALIDSLIEAVKEGFSEAEKAFSSLSFSKLKTVRKANVSDEEAQKRVKDIRDEVKKKVKDINNSMFSIPMEESIDNLKAMYPLMKELSALVLEFNERYKNAKKERGILDFNDLEHYCLDILVDKSSGEIKPSSVALELRENFEEILVDEYQDSNNVQETIVNMVSRKFTENPNVFMVGDVKQSIYRFRQAKPELFLDKYNSYSEEEGSLNRKILLYKNFRSREEVIKGVNYIFKELMTTTVGELDYTSKEALNLGADFKENEEEGVFVGGDIEVHILDRSSEKSKEDIEEEEEVTGVEEGVEELSEEELDNIQLEARLTAKRIKELINPDEGGEFKVYDKALENYRRVRYKDIVILLRATTEWAPIFAEELGLQGIPVYSDSGTGYFQTVEIRTIMSLLQVIDNPMQDIPMLAVLRSPIFAFTPEDLSDLRAANKENYFYESIRAIAEGSEDIKVSKDELKEKCIYFMEYLEKWREKSIYMPIDEFIWYLYMDTSYYGYVGAMPKGVQRQANLRILFQRAREYDKTSYKGLFNFINFINKLRKSSGDLGSAKILGENEDVVRIMSIHKSKGLEFPVVILSGTGKNFNLMDLNRSILFHEELGYGPDFVDIENRISYPTIAKEAIKRKFRLESLSEEMRVLYVAFTRAKEKLIITGSVNNLSSSAEKWCQAAASEGRIPESQVLKGKSYLDWIAMALAKHTQGEAIRNINNSTVNITSQDELSTWNVKLWDKKQVIVDEKNPAVDNLEEDNEFKSQEGVYTEEINRRLSWEYKYKYSSKLPANISVSELKRQSLKAEYDGEYVRLYTPETLRKPEFLQENRGLSPAERGTAVHFVMQHLDLNKVHSIEQINNQMDQMVNQELIREDERKAVNIRKILSFFKSSLGQRLLKAYSENKVYREIPFFIEVPSTVVKPELPEDIYQEEKIRVQGIIDCFFEEEGKLVLLDYKTDYVEEGGEENIKERYRVQIDYYCESLLRLTGMQVKEKYLYLFYNGSIVEM
ncbi:helicase-exonuclease AddAB subunit AddA [Clostridium polynesiense]|uniref:helicase-exonuclease AddAB subunit AddA n=1 Tax=Clostridium polynesiense TaxID=1325933 RepID=UPI00058C621F|nr:helicase-exonuclease AddAB subunit AddA [Clostridium polynesiense]